MSSGKSCLAADGNDRGKPCDLNSKCDATKGLTCNLGTGLCDFSSPGGLGDPCGSDADCNSAKYPGLHCNAKNKCDCTDASSVLQLCSDNMVCVSGGGPAPPPPPPATSWPSNFTPFPPDDFVKNKFTGSCAASAWFNASSGDPKCAKGNLGLQANGGAQVCMTTSDYQSNAGAVPGAYQKACYIDA